MYIEGAIIGVPAQSPTQRMPVLYLVNDGTGMDIPQGVWSQVDCAAIVPVGTKAIRLDGILIITMGSVSEQCDLTVAVRCREDSWDNAYIMQALCVPAAGGIRTNGGTWIALDDNRQFQVKWQVSTPSGEGHATAGANLSLTAYVR